jgi:hypothetical protein
MTLQEVAKTYKKAVAKAIYPGVSYPRYQKTGRSRAFDTGNLLTQIVRQQVKVRKDKKLGMTFTINVAPDDALYGTYVHFGTYKMQARPFAEIGTNDDKFNEQLDALMEENIDEFADQEIEMVFEGFKKAGFSIK